MRTALQHDGPNHLCWPTRARAQHKPERIPMLDQLVEVSRGLQLQSEQKLEDTVNNKTRLFYQLT